MTESKENIMAMLPFFGRTREVGRLPVTPGWAWRQLKMLRPFLWMVILREETRRGEEKDASRPKKNVSCRRKYCGLCGGGGKRRDHWRKVDCLRKKDGGEEEQTSHPQEMNPQKGVVYGNWGPRKRIGWLLVCGQAIRRSDEYDQQAASWNRGELSEDGW